MKTVKTYTLDNVWQVEFEPENLDEEGWPYNVQINISASNGDIFEHQISGSVKATGCCDWGFNQRVMFHSCGPKDMEIFKIVFDDAVAMIGPLYDY